MKNEKESKEIAHYVFSGSTTMIGVCITVIALFKALNAGLQTYADEILGVNVLVFILSTFFSYLSIRNNAKKWEKIADYLFFIGLIILLVVGIMIIFSTY